MEHTRGTTTLNGLVELTQDISTSPLFNPDLAPTKVAQRTWNLWNIAALWIGMAICIPTYMLAAGLMSQGMNWWQAVLTITLGNLIVFIPMALNAHAGTKYGIPFPVLLRSSFGVYGSNIPALLRAIVACGWFGIQTWIGGKALYILAAVLVPSITQSTRIEWLSINGWQFFFFFLFWAINLYFVFKGTESIKWLETYSAPILILIGGALLGWGILEGGGLRKILDHSSNFTRATVSAVRGDGPEMLSLTLSPVLVDGTSRAVMYRTAFQEFDLEKSPWERLEGRRDPGIPGFHVFYEIPCPKQAGTLFVEFADSQGRSAKTSVSIHSKRPSSTFWLLFIPALTAMVGYWATLSLNIPDFTRYAKSQKDQALGQLIGLPTTMGLYAFIGVAVTGAALVIFPDILITEQAPWDPVDLLKRFDNPLLIIGAMFFLAIATLTTNIAANVVSPANDFSNVCPKWISFKTGGIITAVIGILMMPWKLLERPDVYIFNWLIGYGALLGPIAGIMIADYTVVRRRKLEVPELYKTSGLYGDINLVTLVILALAILPNVPGFLASLGFATNVASFWKELFTYAWFVGFGIAFVLYSSWGLWKRTAT